MSKEYDLHDLVNGTGKQTNFTTMLIKLIFKADDNNIEQLRLGFPDVVAMVENYRKTGEINITIVKEV